MQYKNIHRIEKIPEHLRTKGGKRHFSRTTQEQTKFINIQEFQVPVFTLQVEVNTEDNNNSNFHLNVNEAPFKQCRRNYKKLFNREIKVYSHI